MLKFLSISLVVLILVSCQKPDEKYQLMVDEATASKGKFRDVTFESSTDVVCGMSLAIGISDTARYKGKNYGFCCKLCKAEFQKSQEKFIQKQIVISD